MRTVLFVHGAGERAGAEQVTLNLLRHIDPDRYRPVVAFLDEGPFVEETAAAGFEVVRLPTAGRLRRLDRLPSTVARLRATINSSGADLVQATGEKMAVISAWAARWAGRPAVFWLHDAPTCRPATVAVQLAMAASPRAEVVTCGRWMASAFQARYGLRAVPIPNGVDRRLLDMSTAPIGEQLPETGWSPDATVIAHFGRLEQWKGCDIFLRAAAVVARSVPDARFLVVGGALYGRDGAYAAGLAPLARQLGLGDRVHFTGFRPDATELMAACDVVAHCSRRSEPFAMVVVEAMALGLAVVATTTGGPVEAIGSVAGLLVPPGDPLALSAAIVGLAREPALRRILGERARARVDANLSADRMAADFEDIWDRVLDDSRQSGRPALNAALWPGAAPLRRGGLCD